MIKILMTIFLISIGFCSFSQEKFRLDYNIVAKYDPDTETWGNWEKGDNTFVININSRGDIAHYPSNGKMVTYRKVSGTVEGYTPKEHKHYQFITALDEKGNEFRFQLFDDKSVGLKLMLGSYMFQFAER